MATEGSETLLPHYLRELSYLHSAGTAFAQKFPRVAEALEISAHGSGDPHVQRLIESFAFLTARLQRTYEAEFPDIPAALLEVLYPQLAAPLPSMSIAAFLIDPQQSRALAGITVPAGTMLFATADMAGEPPTCRFRTGHPVTLWPIEVAEAVLEPRTLYRFLDARPQFQDVQSVLRIRLRCLGNRRFDEFAPPALRFYLPPGGDGSGRDAIHELLFTQTRGVAVAPLAPGAELPDGPIPAAVPCGARIAPVGFAAEEALLPAPPMSHQAYRLVQEYFAFPDKFMFADVVDLPAGAFGSGTHADLLVLLTAAPRTPAGMDAGGLLLGCTPIINLFNRISEPIRLDHTKLDYRLVPDSRLESSTEIHTILRVTRSRAQGGASETIRPLFSYRHADIAGASQAMYVARREPVANPAFEGSEMRLAFVDPELNPTLPAADTVFAHVACTNRGLAEQIAAGTPLHLEVDLPLRGVACLMRPTPQVPAPTKGSTLWRLVSHLSVNHLTITGGSDGLAALREILLLYCATEDATRTRRITGLTGLSTRRVVRHVGADAWRGFCRGLEIELEFDEQAFAGAGAYLLGSVLSRFFGLHGAVNSFTELLMRNRQRGQSWRWPARTGETVLP